MIVVCPSCATRYDLPATAGPQGSIVRCRACGYSWLEGSAVEVADAAPIPALSEPQGLSPDRLSAMADRLARASREAAQAKTEEQRRRQARLRAWGALAACIAVPVALGLLFADAIQDRLPRTSHIYALFGIERSPTFEITRLEQQHLLADGTRVFAIKGEVTNHASAARRAPGLRFELLDQQGRRVYAWTLPAIAPRPMKPGETTPFITRITSPPLAAASVKIGFAPREELALNAVHDGNASGKSAARNSVQ